MALIETLHAARDVFVGMARLSLKRGFPLQRGGVLPAGSLQLKFASYGDASLPAVLLCPSMSNTPFPIDVPELHAKGWWKSVVGHGTEFGIQLDQFRVIVPSPIGSPHGSTSPLTERPDADAHEYDESESGTNSYAKNKDKGKGDARQHRHRHWGPAFPVITPADMADANALLLDALGIEEVHAVIGGSMGGMQVRD